MSYEQKVESARSLFGQHNSNVNEDQKLNFEAFLENLKGIGGTTDEALKACTWEDIESCGFPKVPRLLAKQVANIFRKTPKDEKRPISTRKAESMTISELVAHYDVRDNSSAVWKRLYELSKAQPCIVFNEDGKVNVDASVELINEIRDGEEPREFYLIDGVPQPLYAVGQRPDSFVAENPLAHGEPLRGANEECGITYRRWVNIPTQVRQVLRLALDSGDIVIKQNADIHTVFDRLGGSESGVWKPHSPKILMDLLQTRYPKVILTYHELEKEGRLPSLKLKRGRKVKKTSGKQDPFYSHKRY